MYSLNVKVYICFALDVQVNLLFWQVTSLFCYLNSVLTFLSLWFQHTICPISFSHHLKRSMVGSRLLFLSVNSVSERLRGYVFQKRRIAADIIIAQKVYFVLVMPTKKKNNYIRNRKQSKWAVEYSWWCFVV